MRRTLSSLLILLGSCASPPPAPPPEGLVSADLMGLKDPLLAVAQRLDALDPLLEGVSAEEPKDDLPFRLAHEIAELLSRPEFVLAPLLAGRLRTQVFLQARGDLPRRRAAQVESRRLWQGIKQRLASLSAAAVSQRPGGQTENKP